MAISRVGKELYEMLIRPYTKKQWDKYPKVSSSSGPVAKTSFTMTNAMTKTIALTTLILQGLYIQELDAEVFTRLPYRENRDDR